MIKVKNTPRIAPSTMDVRTEELPGRTIMAAEYRRLGGIPIESTSNMGPGAMFINDRELREHPEEPMSQFTSGETNSPNQHPLNPKI